MTELTAEAKADRIRAAIAEVGFPDPKLVKPHPTVAGAVLMSGAVPLAVQWQAREVTTEGDPVCFECFKAAIVVSAAGGAAGEAQVRAMYDACEAYLPVTADCGATTTTEES